MDGCYAARECDLLRGTVGMSNERNIVEMPARKDMPLGVVHGAWNCRLEKIGFPTVRDGSNGILSLQFEAEGRNMDRNHFEHKNWANLSMARSPSDGRFEKFNCIYVYRMALTCSVQFDSCVNHNLLARRPQWDPRHIFVLSFFKCDAEGRFKS